MTIIQPGGGTSSGGAAILFTSTLGGDAATIDSGAGGFTTSGACLGIYYRARTDEAVVQSTVIVRVNADSGANYDRVFVQGANATAAANNAVGQTSWTATVAGASDTAGLFTAGDISLFAYGGTANPKVGRLIVQNPSQTAANTYVIVYALGYRSATAISRVSITNGGGTVLKAGSQLTVVQLF